MGAERTFILDDSLLGFSPLLASQGILAGTASIVDLFGIMPEYNRCNDGEQADFFATHYDWVKIGADLRFALVAELAEAYGEASEA
jgi:hypothetical protein